MVIGFETDVQLSGQKGGATFPGAIPGSRSRPMRSSSGSDVADPPGFLATPSILLYGTAGVAYGKVKDNATVALIASARHCSFTDVKGGWTAGAGVEGAFGGGWSAKLEYLYIDLARPSTRSAPSRWGRSRRRLAHDRQHRARRRELSVGRLIGPVDLRPAGPDARLGGRAWPTGLPDATALSSKAEVICTTRSPRRRGPAASARHGTAEHPGGRQVERQHNCFRERHRRVAGRAAAHEIILNLETENPLRPRRLSGPGRIVLTISLVC